MDRWLLVVGVMSVVAASAGAAPPVAKPNISVILADDFGFECVGANGGQSYKTPHLDRRAAGGVRFDHCRVQPLCTPTRVELMTGRSNVRNYLNFGHLGADRDDFRPAAQEGRARHRQMAAGQEKDAPQHFGFDEAYLWQHTRRPPR